VFFLQARRGESMSFLHNSVALEGLPKFSVVITVRNEGSSIEAVVEGLLTQSFAPDEIIIVDGVSTDGTLDKLQHYASQGRICLISQSCNIAQGRNIGIKRANNAFIAVTDAGCHIDVDWLRELAISFATHPDADVVAGNYKFEINSVFEEAVVLATDSPDRETSDQARFYPSSRSVAFKKTAWEAVKGYPEWLYAAEDTLFNIRLREMGFNFVFCPNAIVRWRPRTSLGSMMRQFFNYARGNGRVGIGTMGYLTNLQNHGISLLLLLLGAWHWSIAIAGIGFLALHIKRYMWPQACIAATRSRVPGMRWRVVAIMELVRILGMAGFLAGRYDRKWNSSFVQSQIQWMGVGLLDEGKPPHDRES
jgi:glycosyltransferase involved in cell wall biosynthesis